MCFGVVFTCANFLVVGCALPYLLPKYLPIVYIGYNMVCGNKTSCKHGAWNTGFLLDWKCETRVLFLLRVTANQQRCGWAPATITQSQWVGHGQRGGLNYLEEDSDLLNTVAAHKLTKPYSSQLWAVIVKVFSSFTWLVILELAWSFLTAL